MTERTAIALVFTAMLAVMAAAYIALLAMHASDNVVVLAYILVLAGGAHASSSVVMHYGSKHRGR